MEKNTLPKGVSVVGKKPNPKFQQLPEDLNKQVESLEDNKRLLTRKEYAEMKDYSKKLKSLCADTKAQNEEEIEYAKKLMDKFADPKYIHAELPILAHNFTLLAPAKRFLIYDLNIKLLELVKQKTKVFTEPRRVMKFYINTLKQVKREDTEEDVIMASVQPGLATYFAACGNFRIAQTKEMIAVLDDIKNYIVSELPKVIEHKQATIGRCEAILSKKLIGEGAEPPEFREEEESAE